MEILLTLALLAPVVWMLERTHRRTRDLPRTPFGADAESEASSAYRRQMAELRQLTQLMDESVSTVSTEPRRADAAAVRTVGALGTVGVLRTPTAPGTAHPAIRGSEDHSVTTATTAAPTDSPLVAASTARRLERTMGAGFAPLGGWAGTATMVKPN